MNYFEIFKEFKFIDEDHEITLDKNKENKYEDLLLINDLFFNNNEISLEGKKKLIDNLTEKFYRIKNNIEKEKSL